MIYFSSTPTYFVLRKKFTAVLVLYVGRRSSQQDGPLIVSSMLRKETFLVSPQGCTVINFICGQEREQENARRHL